MDLRKQSQLLLFMILLTLGVCQFACGGEDDCNTSQDNAQTSDSEKQDTTQENNSQDSTIPPGTVCIHFVETNEEYCSPEKDIISLRTVSEGMVSFEITVPYNDFDDGEYYRFDPEWKIVITGSIPEGSTTPREASTFSVNFPSEGFCQYYTKTDQSPYNCDYHDDTKPDITRTCYKQISQDATGNFTVLELSPDGVSATFGGNPFALTDHCCMSDAICPEASFIDLINQDFVGKMNVTF